MVVRQQPQSSHGVVFVTMEDETGSINVINWANVYNASRYAINQARLILVASTIQQEGVIIHVLAKRAIDITDMLEELNSPGYVDMPLLVYRADEIKHGQRAAGGK